MKRLSILLVLAAAGAVAACTPSNTGASPTLPVESTAPSIAAPSSEAPSVAAPSSEAPSMSAAPSESGSGGMPSESASPSSS